MKSVVRFIIFLLAMLFFPHFSLAEDIIPLPVLKEKNHLKNNLNDNSAAVIKKAEDFFDRSKPLSKVELPEGWNAKIKKSPKGRKVTATRKKPRAKKISSKLKEKLPKGSEIHNPIRLRYILLPIPEPIKKKWEQSEIDKAKAECSQLMRNIKAEYEPMNPIRLGQCGTPAPVKLASIDVKDKQVVRIKPAATFNCTIAAKVTDWVKEQLQPIAMTYLNTSIVQIHNVASYSCRNRYNASDKKLSEHARANAFDIAGFTTEQGEFISVLNHWDGDDKFAKFLHAVHASACKTFVVVLGPNANEAHKNHFHFDLGRYPVCE